MAFLEKRKDNYFLHDKATRQAQEDIFADYPEQQVEFRAAGGKIHTYRAQCRETDYNYVHRRMEDVGWYYRLSCLTAIQLNDCSTIMGGHMMLAI